MTNAMALASFALDRIGNGDSLLHGLSGVDFGSDVRLESLRRCAVFEWHSVLSVLSMLNTKPRLPPYPIDCRDPKQLV